MVRKQKTAFPLFDFQSKLQPHKDVLSQETRGSARFSPALTSTSTIQLYLSVCFLSSQLTGLLEQKAVDDKKQQQQQKMI